MRRLLQAGANPDARCTDGTTTLIWAANVGSLPTLRLLLKAGADPEAVAGGDRPSARRHRTVTSPNGRRAREGPTGIERHGPYAV